MIFSGAINFHILTSRRNPMIEIRLSTGPRDNTLVTFDGHILEFFTWEERESSRYHVFKFAKIDIATDKQGKNTLSIWSKYVNELLYGPQPIRDEVLTDTQALVATVREAMTLYS